MVEILLLLSSAVSAAPVSSVCAERLHAAGIEEGAYGADRILAEILDGTCIDSSRPALRSVIRRVGRDRYFDAGVALRKLISDENELFGKVCSGVSTATLRKRGVPVGRLEGPLSAGTVGL